MTQITFTIGSDLTDEEIREAFKASLEEDAADTFFYHLDMNDFSLDDLVNIARKKLFVLVREEKKMLAYIFVDEVMPGVGAVSYYGFKSVRGIDSIEIGKAFLKYMLMYFKTMIGITPINKPVVKKFNEKIGMTEIGIIPNSCFSIKDKKYYDGILTYITK